jgi:hypothetical protein
MTEQEFKTKKSILNTQLKIFKLEERIEILEKLIKVNKNLAGLKEKVYAYENN